MTFDLRQTNHVSAGVREDDTRTDVRSARVCSPRAPALRSSLTRPVDPFEGRVRAAIAAGRDAHALELIDAAYGPALRRLASRMMKDESAADVVQEALLRIYQGLRRLRDGSSVRAWVMTVAAHCALDELRRRTRRRRHLVDSPDMFDIAAAGPLPPDILEASEMRSLLTERVDALPATIRESVLLYFGQQLTFDQVAGLLGGSEGAVQVRVKRALARLRPQLQTVSNVDRARTHAALASR